MEINNAFVVPASIEEAWMTLLDVERLVPCMPGATLDAYDGEQVDGKMRVKLGPITVSYVGTVRFVERDSQTHRVVIQASGKERTGAGTADAQITAGLVEEGEHTRVVVVTDLDISGRPAQFGRGMIASVAQSIIDRFAANLAEAMAAGPPEETSEPGVVEAPTGPKAASEPYAPASSHPASAEPESLDVLGLLGSGRINYESLLPCAVAALVGFVVGRSLSRQAAPR